MEKLRKPFQGVTNIIRFNWHFYLLSSIIVLMLLISNYFLNKNFHFYINVLCTIIIATTLITLIASFYIYDLSNLYSLSWLNGLTIKPNASIININAGFDETSELLSLKFPAAELTVFDFYDPRKHTEVSIKRARKAYPPYKNTIAINTTTLPLKNNSADNILVIFAAHEIRNNDERIFFLKELHRVLKDDGKIIITEHLRDLPNFIVYNIGFFHFLPLATWLATFNNAQLKVSEEIKTTAFITSFILTKNDIAS
jgi:ubiquinone/menaquinone biosynthesis C-methylase UbiE